MNNDNLRTFKVYRNNKWEVVPIQKIQIGEVFVAYEDGKMIIQNGTHFFRAQSYARVVEGSDIFGIDCEPVMNAEEFI